MKKRKQKEEKLTPKNVDSSKNYTLWWEEIFPEGAL